MRDLSTGTAVDFSIGGKSIKINTCCISLSGEISPTHNTVFINPKCREFPARVSFDDMYSEGFITLNDSQSFTMMPLKTMVKVISMSKSKQPRPVCYWAEIT